MRKLIMRGKDYSHLTLAIDRLTRFAIRAEYLYFVVWVSD